VRLRRVRWLVSSVSRFYLCIALLVPRRRLVLFLLRRVRVFLCILPLRGLGRRGLRGSARLGLGPSGVGRGGGLGGVAGGSAGGLGGGGPWWWWWCCGVDESKMGS